MELLLAIFFGAVFGSYSTLFAYRLPRGETCLGRFKSGQKSRCPNCSNIIKTRHLIPIINWLLTMGKCPNCQAKIPKTHLVIEVSTTILFTICYLKFNLSEQFIIYSLIFTGLVIISITNCTHQIFPFQALIFLTIIALCLQITKLNSIEPLILACFYGIICATLFFQIFHIKFKNLIKNDEQAFSFAKLILIIAIILPVTKYLTYITITFTIFAILYILRKYFKPDILGLALTIPLIILILTWTTITK